MAHLAANWGADGPLIKRALSTEEGESAVAIGEWVYEAHAAAPGVDLYEHALSWTSFKATGHAYAAGLAMARMHRAAEGYEAPARMQQQLVSSFTIFAGTHFPWPDGLVNDNPLARMAAYLEARPILKAYAEKRAWRQTLKALHLPLYAKLQPWLGFLKPLWTHNDLHASNMMWSGGEANAAVTAIIDFGLADRTCAVHDLVSAIERNGIEWLRMDQASTSIVRLEQVDALLAGYEAIRPLRYEEARALVAMLPLVHCEFALSETDYFLSILHSQERAFLAYEGYFVKHTQWFLAGEGRELLESLRSWAEAKAGPDNRR